MKRALIFFALGLTACSSVHYLRRDAASYNQQTAESLTKTWGPPTATRDLDGGVTEYEYSDDAGFTHTYNPRTHEMDSIPNGCLTIFTLNMEKVVTGWKAKGEHCEDVTGIVPSKP